MTKTKSQIIYEPDGNGCDWCTPGRNKIIQGGNAKFPNCKVCGKVLWKLNSTKENYMNKTPTREKVEKPTDKDVVEATFKKGKRLPQPKLEKEHCNLCGDFEAVPDYTCDRCGSKMCAECSREVDEGTACTECTEL